MDDWSFPNRATPRGSAAYYGIRFAPPGLRDDLARLTAWRHGLTDILEAVSDPGVARQKLDWWRTELIETLASRPRHPLSIALTPALTRHRLPAHPFDAMADRVAAEIARHTPPDRAAWEAAEEADLGALFELLARCHGLADDARLAQARRAGGFCGQVYRLRDAGRLVRAGRSVLPRDQLTELPPGPLADQAQRRRLTPLIADAAAETKRYRTQIDAAELPVCLRVRVRLAERLLAELAAADFAVTEARIALTPLNKLWHGWRESRHR